MAIILFDDNAYQTLLPLTFTRPVADLRLGILTIAEKWSRRLKADHSFLTRDYLQAKFPVKYETENILINGAVCPDEEICEAIDKLKTGEAITYRDMLVAVKLDESSARDFTGQASLYQTTEHSPRISYIRHPEDIFRNNDIELRKDFKLITAGRTSASISGTNTIIGNDFFAEEGAVAECSSFSTINGPIYLSATSEVWEGVNIRGAFAICEHSQVKMGAKIYGATTVGPYSRVGGEINNSVIWGYSAKGHEGYLGNSVMGEWCNIGADSNNSNLKNNYAEVRLWDYTTKSMRGTGLQFCGLIMADHAKCGINTMFNTGTVVGVGANVFDAGFPPHHVPDFTWGGAHGLEEYRLDKMLATTTKVFARKDHREFNEVEQGILESVFALTSEYRE